MGGPRIPKWRPKAWDDLENHAVYLGIAGDAFLDCVRNTVALLCSYPDLGGVFETTHPGLEGLRAKLVKGFPRYVVFYRPSDEAIEVVRVLGGGQDMFVLVDSD